MYGDRASGTRNEHRHRRVPFAAFVVGGAVLLASVLPCMGDDLRPEETSQLVQIGEKLYGEYCAFCHGTRGKGDGTAAYLLLPKPRDFSEGKFNRKNTPPGNLPSDEDLFEAVSEGLLGSSMPPWKDYLTEKERWALVYYLKKELIADYYEETGEVFSLYEFDPPKDPLPVPEEVPATPENIAIGSGIYQSVAECWTCHGRAGRGEGPKSQNIVNARGERIYPIDLAKGIYKLSSSNEEIFRRIRDGITLAPMYSMGNKLTDEEVWCLVHYVRSLVNRTDEQRKMNEQRRRTIKVRKVDGDLPGGADDERWKESSPTYIPLMPLWWRRDRVEGVFVRAVHNGKDISIQLSWGDDTEDRSVLRHEAFRDGVAIQFSAERRPPFFGMGGAGNGVVNIWHWKSDWEAEQSVYRDMEGEYPNMASDHYQFRKDNVFGEHGQEEADISKHDPVFLTGWGSGNLLSIPDRKTSVEDLNARGFGTLTSQARYGQGVRGAGGWYKGLWRVVFTRALSSKDEADATFSSGKSVNVGFAVWNGSQGDRNGQKQVSIWHELVLE